MQPEIPVHKPFKKTWSEPQIVITLEDIIEYENSQKVNPILQSDIENTAKSQELGPESEHSKPTAEHPGDCRTTPETRATRLMDLQNSLLQSHIVRQQLHTPKKYCNNLSDSTVSNTLCQDSDWIIPQHSLPRAIPSSLLIGAIPQVTLSQTIAASQEKFFSFPPDRLRHLEETHHFSESDEVDNGFRLPQRCCNSPPGVQRCYPGLDTSPVSTGRTRSSRYCQPEIAYNQPERAKRKLDMDDPYSTSVKRAKSELSYDAGLRYVNQLEMDLMSLKHKVQYASQEIVNNHTNCACAEMEKHFMEMATSAYKSIRRYDGTMNSFQQFKQELTQTNQVIKDSMELLQNVRRLCVH